MMTRSFMLPFLLLCLPALAAAPAAAEEARAPVPPQIVSQGSAEIHVAPDRAILRFGVQIDAAEAQTAQQRVGETMNRVIQSLHRLSIPENRVSTERLDLMPLYEPPAPGREGSPRLTGYRAANVVRVELDDLSRIGPVIDAAVGAGANTIEGIQFAVANEAPARTDALRQASLQARSRAQAIADALGVHLGQLLEASESGVEVVPPRPVFLERAAAPSTPIQPGEMTVQATVTVHYAVSP